MIHTSKLLHVTIKTDEIIFDSQNYLHWCLCKKQNVVWLDSMRDANLIVRLTSRLHVWQSSCLIITLPSRPGLEFEAGINFVGVCVSSHPFMYHKQYQE